MTDTSGGAGAASDAGTTTETTDDTYVAALDRKEAESLVERLTEKVSMSERDLAGAKDALKAAKADLKGTD